VNLEGTTSFTAMRAAERGLVYQDHLFDGA
jgi:hypothetical protein